MVIYTLIFQNLCFINLNWRGRTRNIEKISIASSSSYSGLLGPILRRVFCQDLLNKQMYVSQALVEGNTDIQGNQN